MRRDSFYLLAVAGDLWSTCCTALGSGHARVGSSMQDA